MKAQHHSRGILMYALHIQPNINSRHGFKINLKEDDLRQIDLCILAFESHWWKTDPLKEQASLKTLTGLQF